MTSNFRYLLKHFSMEYRRMGRSGLQLSVLSYGSWVTFHKQLDDNKADELMGIAYDNGVNFLIMLKCIVAAKVKRSWAGF